MHQQLQPFIDDRYISKQKHPTLDLWIYNYTQKTQYEGHWTPETLMCRGLILDADGNIAARPFQKFKNLEEYGPEWTPPTEPFTVTQKLDGSLGILYPTDGLPCIATRGSFTSDQAHHANKIFRDRYPDLPWESERYTYLFEIIYPENRIVVDYQGLDDLILLGVVETATGIEQPLPDWFPNHVTQYNGLTDLYALKTLSKDNEEGFVIRFASGLRLKVKFEEYVRLHRLVTGVTARSIWELMANGSDITELLERVPEEFEEWVKKTAAYIQEQFDNIESASTAAFKEVAKLPTRKEQATCGIMSTFPEIKSIIFAMLDDKPYHHIIWKMIKPKAERPFKEADA